MKDVHYFSLCKECEYLYHCYGRKIAEDIQSGKTEDMYQLNDTCVNYYPEIKQ